MRDAVVFSPKTQLEFQEVRMNVTRIPEVMARVREAEAPWEFALGPNAGDLTSDLASFVVTEDERFVAATRRRLVATAVVQIGLFDRYVRAHGEPAYLVGAIDGPLSVATGRRPLSDFVLESVRAESISPATATWWTKRGEFTWAPIDEAAARPERVVAVGPGSTRGALAAGLPFVDSVDLDPALAWFWTSLTASGLSIAN